MEFIWVLVACLVIGAALILVCAAASNAGNDEPLVQVNVGGTVKNSCGSGSCNSSKCGKKQFPAMKKGSKFVIDGRVA